jgi:hypothetical protein
MEMNILLNRLSVEAHEIDRNTLLEKLRGTFDQDVAGAILQEIEKQATKHGVTFHRSVSEGDQHG